MPTTKTKKKLILEYREERDLKQAGAPEVRAIQAELVRRLGSGQRTSLSYIANVLREAGTTVEYDDPYVDPPLPPPYASRLEGVLEFSDLDSAERTLRKLDTAYREYGNLSDREGTKLVAKLALKAKQRCERVAGNHRVSEEKRQEKREIAAWFRVWLQTPDLFLDWLELRKKSDEFQRLFRRERA